MNHLTRTWGFLNQNFGGIILVVVAVGIFWIAVPILAWRVKPEGQLVAVAAGALFTGLFGGLLAWQQRSHEEKRERRKFRILKLEEAHKISRLVALGLSKNYVQLSTALVAPNMSEMTKQECDKFRQPGEPATLSQLSMLIDFYFPELRPQLDEIIEAQNEYGRVLGTPTLNAILTDPSAKAGVRKDLQARHTTFLEVIDTFQNAISKVARDL